MLKVQKLLSAVKSDVQNVTDSDQSGEIATSLNTFWHLNRMYNSHLAYELEIPILSWWEISTDSYPKKGSKTKLLDALCDFNHESC